MIQAVRDNIQGYLGSSQRDNISLFFNRLCSEIDEPKFKKHLAQDKALVNLVAGYSNDTFKLYNHAFRSWQQDLNNDPEVLSFSMITSAPMVVGVGEQNVHEFGITLQAPWATPVIPGSALKGVISSFAHSQGGADWHKGIMATSKNGLSPNSGTHALNLFGGTDAQNEAFAGLVDFFPAWWIPTPKSPFIEDIINVHNRSYYQNGEAWPDGTDSPVPNKFIVIKPGDSFLFAFRGPSAWIELTKKISQQAAENQGFGAKTRLGYGRLIYCKTDAESCEEIPQFDNQKLAKFYDEHKNNHTFDSAFRKAATIREYASELNKLFRKFRPVSCFITELEAIPSPDWKKIKNLYEQYKNSLKSNPPDPGQADVQKVFNFCRSHAPEAIPPWLQAFAPAARDFLVDKSADEIVAFLESWDQAQPTLNDFAAAINLLHLDEEEKEYCLLILDERRDRLQ